MEPFEWSMVLVTTLAAIVLFYGTLGLVSLSLNWMGRAYSRWARPNTEATVETCENDQLGIPAPLV